jgi:hypothetical protein
LSYANLADSSGRIAWFAPLAEPIRSEQFSVERLEQHAESPAAAERVCLKASAARQHARRLYANTKVLTAAYRAIVKATRAHQAIKPAVEWLRDNFHVALQPEAEDALERRAIGPAGRAGVPCPAAAPDMRRHRIDDGREPPRASLSRMKAATR